MTTVSEPGAFLVKEPAAPFDALFNFRDLGGHPTLGGERTRHGSVFRADGVHRCTVDDVGRLEQLGVRRVVDLRTVHERREDGCFDPKHPEIDYRHVPLLDDVARSGTAAPTVREQPLVATYLEIVSTRGERIVEALRVIVDAPGPVVFHCTAGKDRTGLVAALLLASVGVPDATIIADYAKSREAMARLVDWYRRNRAEERPLVPVPDDGSRDLLGAEPEWMQTVLDTVRAEYGSVRRYLVTAGATPTLIDAVYDKLVG